MGINGAVCAACALCAVCACARAYMVVYLRMPSAGTTGVKDNPSPPTHFEVKLHLSFTSVRIPKGIKVKFHFPLLPNLVNVREAG